MHLSVVIRPTAILFCFYLLYSLNGYSVVFLHITLLIFDNKTKVHHAVFATSSDTPVYFSAHSDH